MKIEYLFFNTIVILGSLLAPIFYKKTKIPKIYKAMPAVLISAFIFVILDNLFTDWFWRFDEKYVLGIKIFKIPLEEMLFFLAFPYICLLIWENWKEKFSKKEISKYRLFIVILGGLLAGFLSYQKDLFYTSFMMFGIAVVIVFDLFLKTNVFRQKRFHTFQLVVFLPIFIYNFYLTARPVVIYNHFVKTNLKLLTIPFENFVFWFLLIALTIIIYESRLLKTFKNW